MIASTKITSKGQITLPKVVRNLLNVKEGNLVVFVKEDNKIVIKSAKTLKDFKGILKGKGSEHDVDEIRKQAKKHVVKKVMQRGKT